MTADDLADALDAAVAYARQTLLTDAALPPQYVLSIGTGLMPVLPTRPHQGAQETVELVQVMTATFWPEWVAFVMAGPHPDADTPAETADTVYVYVTTPEGWDAHIAAIRRDGAGSPRELVDITQQTGPVGGPFDQIYPPQKPDHMLREQGLAYLNQVLGAERVRPLAEQAGLEDPMG